jgi:hypothetical protein
MNHYSLSSTSTSINNVPAVNKYSVPDIALSPLSCLDEDIDSNPRILSPPPPPVSTYIINTLFDPQLKRNTKVEYADRKDPQARFKFTEKERAFALLAKEPPSLDEFSKAVSNFHIYDTIY